MSADPSGLIAVADKQLAHLRKLWMSAPNRDKASWIQQINAALDQRIELMRIRDKTQPLGCA